MFNFKEGQRWISEMEPELGLGTLFEEKNNRITIHFTGSNCTRQYALTTAPLKRVKFKEGDEILTSDNQKYLVDSVEEKNHLFYYISSGFEISEKDLSDTMSFTSPKDRIFAGLFDSVKNFNLRYEANLQKYKAEKSDVTGFIGGKIELIPHQFYIANIVSQRFVPRVLLSDETGLGKTIEACLIINRLLLNEQIGRVLIIVPDSLVHQWFIELYRRFNLSFNIYRDDCLKDSVDNPFMENQTGIVSFDLITENPQINEKIIEAGYDLVVVDEAHHLDAGSTTYNFIKALTGRKTGLILLTATPEQLGEENHFHHLALLDSKRYSSFEAYQKDRSEYKKVVNHIISLQKEGKDKEIEELLDQRGPGRAVFRNTRETIKGFPQRKGVLYPLNGSDKNAKLIWLRDILKELKGKKTFLICESRERSVEIESYLKSNIKLNIALFNEDMTILQRDRSAAWFSEENGAMVLICSEIGGEGRNFQFASELIMMDVPFNPELIEQRIGRLDRIGQKNEITIHLPYIKKSPEALLVNWYDNLGLFKQNINGIHQIFTKFKDTISKLIGDVSQTGEINKNRVEALLNETDDYKVKLLKKLSDGKDILIELNSFRPNVSKGLIKSIQAEDSEELDDFMIRIFEHFNVPYEDTLKRTYKLYLAKVDSGFPTPPLKQNQMMITFDRDLSVTRDDIDFMSQDHPMVSDCIDLLISAETGNTAIGEIDAGEFKLVLESVYILECVAPANVYIRKFLPKTPIRVVIDHTMKDVTKEYSFDQFKDLKNGDKSFLNVPEIKEKLLPNIIAQTLKKAEAVATKTKEEANLAAIEISGGEVKRLERLKENNPGIRDEEIEAAKYQTKMLSEYIMKGRLRLDALRVVLFK